MLNILDRGDDSGGLTVRRDDPRALAEALRRLADGPEFRRGLERRARRNVDERFCIEAIGPQLGTY
jgi:glycosyltransferase involved in cell wall biosynthesis